MTTNQPFRRSVVPIFVFLVTLLTFIPTTLMAQTQTIVVSPTPGNPVQSGNTLRSAVDNLTPGNQWGTRYVVKVEAGVYDLASTPLQMKEWVDIEGSGRDTTLIKGAPTASLPTTGVILGAANAELRSMQIQASSSGSAIAVYTLEATRLRDLRLTATTSGSCWGVRSIGGNITVEDTKIYLNCSGYSSGVTVKSSGRASLDRVDIRSLGATNHFDNVGVWFDGNSMPYLFRDIEIYAGNSTSPGTGVRIGNNHAGWFEVIRAYIHTSGGTGIYSDQPLSLNVRHSKIVASDVGIHMDYGQWLFVYQSLVSGTTNTIWISGMVKVGGSQLDGGPLWASSSKCAAIYDENFDFFPDTCP